MMVFWSPILAQMGYPPAREDCCSAEFISRTHAWTGRGSIQNGGGAILQIPGAKREKRMDARLFNFSAEEERRITSGYGAKIPCVLEGKPACVAVVKLSTAVLPP